MPPGRPAKSRLNRDQQRAFGWVSTWPWTRDLGLAEHSLGTHCGNSCEGNHCYSLLIFLSASTELVIPAKPVQDLQVCSVSNKYHGVLSRQLKCSTFQPWLAARTQLVRSEFHFAGACYETNRMINEMILSFGMFQHHWNCFLSA